MSPVVKTILRIIVTTVILLIGFILTISVVTKHGRETDVPDVVGKTLKQGGKILSKENIGFMVVDSLYDPKLPPLAIMDQSPSAGNNVKPGRKIYLTVNATTPPTIKLPNIKDMSKRQARLVLESWGLLVGKESYVPDIAKDAVITMKINGREVKPGLQIPKGTVIDLLLGDGYGDMDVEVPDLIGLTLMEAYTVLQAINLAPGQVIAESAISDSLNAYVYYQNPEYGSNIHVSPGDQINLYITDQIPTNIVQPEKVSEGEQQDDFGTNEKL